MNRFAFLSSVLFSSFALAACSAAPSEDPAAGATSSELSSTRCRSNADCGDLQYCVPSDGQCGGRGTCQARGINLMCMNKVQPVCGCDGATYDNGCIAAKRAVFAAPGACAAAPAPYALQFVDFYDVKQPSATGLDVLELDRDGTFAAYFTDGSFEYGTYYAPTPSFTLPLTFWLTEGSYVWSATITSNAGAMTITRDGATDGATPEDTVGPNESLCDATHGTWSDDEQDPATGLYCTCAAPDSYVPAEGGCVR